MRTRLANGRLLYEERGIQVDIASISAVLGSIKTATDIAKAAHEASNAVERAELKLKLAEIISALADAKIEAASVQEQILTLQAQLELQGEMRFERPHYWRIVGEGRDGPYCQACYDSERKAIRLQLLGNGIWKCEVGDHTFRDDTFRQPLPRTGGRSILGDLDRF
jgi:hypothetical protein